MGAWSAIKKAWKAMDYIPDCPCCRGSGVSPRDYENSRLWWRGQQVWGCFHCDGRGKV